MLGFLELLVLIQVKARRVTAGCAARNHLISNACQRASLIPYRQPQILLATEIEMTANDSTPCQPTSPTKSNHTLSIKSTGRVTQFHCPCCDDIALEVGNLDRAEVCFCPNCNGFVLDNANCGRLINELRAEYTGADVLPPLLDPTQLEVRISCPACNEKMEVHPYYGPGNAIIDSCIHCKLVWFNSGELDRIIKAPGLRQQLLRPPVSQRIEPVRVTESTIAEFDGTGSAMDFATFVVQALFR